MYTNPRGFIGLIALLVVFAVFLIFFFGIGRNRTSDKTGAPGETTVPSAIPTDTLGVGLYDTGMQTIDKAKDTKALLEQKADETMKAGQ